jgi:uncharacterized protein
MKYPALGLFISMLSSQIVHSQSETNTKINRIVVSHALEQSPEGLWYPWIKEIAIAKGLYPEIPQLPNPQRPNMKSWQEAIALVANQAPGNSILLGHSLGCVSLLHFLNSYNGKEKFPLLILVAPTIFDVGYDALKEFFGIPFQLGLLKGKVKNIVVIISPADPVLKPDPLQHGLILVNEADAKLVVIKKGNHFWKEDDYSELKEVIKQEIDATLNDNL